MSDILCITNRGICKSNFLSQLERICAAGPKALVLREKDLSPEAYKDLAKTVLALCKSYEVPCILHSFVDVAASLGATAIHVPLSVLRTMSQEDKARFSVLGASCHSVEDGLEAQSLGCTYITAGHIFETDCKKGLPGRGLDFLKTLCSAISIPVYAIGGIAPDRMAAVKQTGAAGACVMSGLMQCEDPAAYLSQFHQAGEQHEI